MLMLQLISTLREQYKQKVTSLMGNFPHHITYFNDICESVPCNWEIMKQI